MVFRARGEQGDPEVELTKKEAEKLKRGAIQRVRRGEDAVGLKQAAANDDEDEFILKVDAKSAPGAPPPGVMSDEALFANLEGEQAGGGEAEPPNADA